MWTKKQLDYFLQRIEEDIPNVLTNYHEIQGYVKSLFGINENDPNFDDIVIKICEKYGISTDTRYDDCYDELDDYVRNKTDEISNSQIHAFVDGIITCYMNDDIFDKNYMDYIIEESEINPEIFTEDSYNEIKNICEQYFD